jgi:adenosine kinase
VNDATAICGSLAYDIVARYHGRFGDHVLPDGEQRMALSFQVPQLRREFGGCGGNVAYGFSSLGGRACLVGAIGEDGAAYLEHLERLGVDTERVSTVLGVLTAQSYIMTDSVNSQLCSFHAGAMRFSDECDLPSATLARVVLAPDSVAATLMHAAQCRERNVPYLFDPGQSLPGYAPAQLERLLLDAAAVKCNDAEAEQIAALLGCSVDDWSARCAVVIVTAGAAGCRVRERGGAWRDAPGVAASAVVDAVGCGDAFVAAMLWALDHGGGWYEAACAGNIAGAIKIASPGSQNHRMDAAMLAERLRRSYGIELAAAS